MLILNRQNDLANCQFIVSGIDKLKASQRVDDLLIVDEQRKSKPAFQRRGEEVCLPEILSLIFFQ